MAMTIFFAFFGSFLVMTMKVLQRSLWFLIDLIFTVQFLSRPQEVRKNVSVIRGFHKMHKNVNIDNIDINVNFVFPYLCSFLLYWHHMMLINVKLDLTGFGSITF